jgi:opacity protein-like surface antigen
MKTKKLVFTAAIIFAGMTSAIAQEINWGIKAGANYSKVTSKVDPDYIFGFHAGLVAEYKLTPQFALQPELLYSLEGAKAEMDFREGEFFFSSEEKIRLGYINLPVMAKYYATPALSFEAGPQIGFLLSAESEYELSSNFDEFEIDESDTEDIKDEVKKISFGLNFGLAYDISSSLFVQARYHLGLSDISDYDDQDDEFEGDYEEIKNQSFQLSLGYRF